MNNIGRYRLIVPAATAKPSPAIGQSLGPLGINMSQFCKDFNARTSNVRPNVPIQVTIVQYPDKSYKFWLKTPATSWFLKRVARIPMGTGRCKHEIVGNVTLKEIYHIAKCKSMDPPLIGMSLRSICKHVIGTAKSMGITVSKEILPEFKKRDYTPVEDLEQMRKDIRAEKKATSRRGKT